VSHLWKHVKIINGRYIYRYHLPERVKGIFGRAEVRYFLGRNYVLAMSKAVWMTAYIENIIYGGAGMAEDDKFDPRKFTNFMTATSTSGIYNNILDSLRTLALDGDPDTLAKLDIKTAMNNIKKLKSAVPYVPVTIETAVAKWLKWKKVTGVGSNTFAKYSTTGNFIKWAFGKDKALTDLTKDDIDVFIDFMTSHNTPKLDDAIAGNMTIRSFHIGPSGTMSSGYKQSQLSIITSFFSWLCNKGDLITTDFSKFIKDVRIIQKASHHTGKHTKNSLSEEAIKYIYDSVQPFKDSNYTMSYDTRYRYWVYLFMLLSGARPSEICQLMLEDIILAGEPDPLSSRNSTYDFPCFCVRDGDYKSVKNHASVRTVPIHSYIIKQGFLDYYDNRKNVKNERYPKQLFPIKHPEKGGSGSKTCEYFNGLLIPLKNDLNKRKMYGLETNSTIYSIRHNVITMKRTITSCKEEENIMERIVGHTVGSEMDQFYMDNLSPVAMKPLIEKISYNFMKQ